MNYTELKEGEILDPKEEILDDNLLTVPSDRPMLTEQSDKFKPNPKKGVFLILVVIFLTGINQLCLKYIYI